MNNNKTLDRWDIKLIQLLKSNHTNYIDEARAIWAERCNMSIEYVPVNYIFEHLMKLCMDLELVNTNELLRMVKDAHPDSQWKFGVLPNSPDNEYYKNWFRVVASHLRLTEVKYLPGYVKSNFP